MFTQNKTLTYFVNNLETKEATQVVCSCDFSTQVAFQWKEKRINR